MSSQSSGGACITVVLRSNEIPGENNALLAAQQWKIIPKREWFTNILKNSWTRPNSIPPFLHSQGDLLAFKSSLTFNGRVTYGARPCSFRSISKACCQLPNCPYLCDLGISLQPNTNKRRWYPQQHKKLLGTAFLVKPCQACPSTRLSSVEGPALHARTWDSKTNRVLPKDMIPWAPHLL